VFKALEDYIGSVGGKDLVEIGIIAGLIFVVLHFFRGTRGAGIIRGLAIVAASLFLVALLLISQFQLAQLARVLDYLLTIAVLALVIIFQPELRRALLVLGRNPLLRFFVRRSNPVSTEVARAAQSMARRHVGALIVLQRRVGLDHHIQSGVRVDSEVTGELLNTIFWPGSPLHDGAAIVREGRIGAAACQLPLADLADGPSPLGMRHRAALGMSEETDAVVLVVSEENGVVSLAVGGVLRRVKPGDLAGELEALLSEEPDDDRPGDPPNQEEAA
jgi:diadenylate cyclase